MNVEKVIFGFFVLLALTVNFSFFLGEIGSPQYHPAYELFLALVVSLIATVMKLGDRSQLGATLLATSLVADLHLIAAAMLWAYNVNVLGIIGTDATTVRVVGLAGGALIANFASVILLLIETATMRH